MTVHPRKRRNKRSIHLLASLLFLAACYLSYHQLFYKSKTVSSKVFKLISRITAHRSDIWAVKFNPQGNLVASGSVDSTVKIWNKENKTLLLNLKHPSGVTDLDFSSDGAYLVTAAYDEKIRLWQLPQGNLLKEFSGHKGTVWSVDISPDGKTIVSSGEDATIKLWDIGSGRVLRTMQGHQLNVWDTRFSPDGNMIASGSYDKTVKIWNVQKGQLIKTLSGHSQAIVSLAFSHDGKMLASTSDDQSIKLWNTTDWNLLRSWTVPEHVQAAAFSPDDIWLLTSGRDKPAVGEFLQNFFGDAHFNKGVSMRLWEVRTGKLLQTFSEHANDVNDVTFSPDGKWIASGSSDKTIGLWQAN